MEMNKTVSALAVAVALALPVAGHAASADFGGDYTWSGFRTDTSSAEGTASYNTGYTQLMRLKGALKNDDGVSLNFRVKLSDNVQQGDSHTGADAGVAGTPGVATGDSTDIVALDYGYVQFPLAGWTFRVGRQTANWGFNFTSSDDRRDRILAIRKFGGVTVFALTDKRQEGSLSNELDDGDQYSLAAVGVNGGWLWGVLGGYYYGDSDGTYALRGVKLVSAFAKGKAGPIDLTGTINILGGGDDGALFESTAVSEFVRVGWGTGPVKIEGQIVGVQKGGLIATGFDTFSSMINNSPDNSMSNTTVTSIGRGFGVTDVTDGLSEYLGAARVTGKVGDKVTLMAAAGDYIYRNDSDNAALGQAEFNRYFADLQAHYQVTSTLKTWATLGYLSGDDSAKDSAGNDTKLSDQTAWSINLSANF